MKLKFSRKKEEIDSVYSFIFEPNKKIKWQPGQYLHYDLPHPDEDDRGIGRFFTISAAPFEQHIMLTTRFDNEHGSSFKKALLKLEPRTEIEAGEPRGDFLLDPDATKHVLIAGGIGITPYRSMLAQLNHDNKMLDIDLLYANRDEDFVFDEELQSIASKHSELKIFKFVGDKRITEKDVRPYLADENILFYLSGPRPMVENYQHLLEEIDVSPERIKTDYFPGY